MTLNEGDTLLGFGLDVYMWTIWRDFVKLPPVRKISNFYHASSTEMESYDLFQSVFARHKNPNAILVPYVAEMQECFAGKGITLNTSILFDVIVVSLPLLQVDTFLEFVKQKRT